MKGTIREPSELTAYSSQVASAATAASPAAPRLARQTKTKLLLVDFRSGEAVVRHPEIQSYLQQGWQVKSAVPRLVEAGGTKLLVVLTQPAQPMQRVLSA